ncbi:hypothetical protein NMG60_11000603 [Bertholletia excelsa]
MEAENDRENKTTCRGHHVAGSCRSFGEKCGHVARKQRAKFYILRRCIAMLVCWHERSDR